ncbi:hypothetical protein CA601_41780 [Paraburkholderia hospita]|nr:hypothetical protein CA601_41780 [Paraburkholderia hospita]
MNLRRCQGSLADPRPVDGAIVFQPRHRLPPNHGTATRRASAKSAQDASSTGMVPLEFFLIPVDVDGSKALSGI